MIETDLSAARQETEGADEAAQIRRYARKFQELDQALRQEAATLRTLAESREAAQTELAGQLHQAAIRLDAIAWEVRSFDPDDPTADQDGLAGRAGMTERIVPTHNMDSGSGEATRTDLGEGPEGTDTHG